nr:RNA-directed DNA polymerase, eukaryota, reverse transcriptase zinc-binding domain protein [Tanacetum cinerariifolium]
MDRSENTKIEFASITNLQERTPFETRLQLYRTLGFYIEVLETVVKSLESLRASFFWGSSKDSKKLASVKWSNILAFLDRGGIGVGSLKAFNISLLLKWKWHLFYNPNALWVHVVKAIHDDEACIDIRDCHTNGVWASIVWSIFHHHSSGIIPLNFIRFKVGDGSSICFWNDTCSFVFGQVLCFLPFHHVASGIFGFNHGTPQRKRRTALTPSSLLPVGHYGGLEIISLSTLIL